MQTSQPAIKINPIKTAVVLFSVSLLILLFSWLGQLPYETGNPTEKFFRELFTTEFFVNNGENIATYWNMFILMIASMFIFAIASARQARKQKHNLEWWGLGIIFVYFAMDALAGVTHRFAKLLNDLPTMEGGFLYNWLHPVAAVIVILISLFFIWFFLRLNARDKFLFPISLLLYILGAYKAELLGGYYAQLYGTTTSAYLWITHAEEFAEYLGIILIIYFLLTFMSTEVKEIDFTA